MSKAFIILDTDIGTDCDDAGALAMLHTLCETGEAELLACTHSTALKYGAACIDIINTLCGAAGIPVGVNANHTFSSHGEQYDIYATQLAAHYGMLHKSYDTYHKAVPVMRQALSSADDGSVTMVGIGQMCNFADLLTCGPDEFSPLSGYELVKKKVKELVLMAGFFDFSQCEKYSKNLNPGGSEYNIYQHIESARYVTENWPTPIVFSGLEIGYKIMCGTPLSNLNDRNGSALRLAFEHFGGLRHAWDQTAVLYAVRGAGDYWNLSEPGKISVNNEGYTSYESGGRHRYLMKKQPSGEIAEMIDQLMMFSILKQREGVTA